MRTIVFVLGATLLLLGSWGCGDNPVASPNNDALGALTGAQFVLPSADGICTGTGQCIIDFINANQYQADLGKLPNAGTYVYAADGTTGEVMLTPSGGLPFTLEFDNSSPTAGSFTLTDDSGMLVSDGAFTAVLPRFQLCQDALTVADSETGLLWEIKEGIASNDPFFEYYCYDPMDFGCQYIRDVSTTFTWSSYIGEQVYSTEPDGTAYTVFLAALNGGGFAGRTDWRLPKISELQSISIGSGVLQSVPDDPQAGLNPTMQDISEALERPSIDPAFAAVGGPTAGYGYWSATSNSAGGCPEGIDCQGEDAPANAAAWDAGFNNVYGFNPKYSANAVRAVRSGSCNPVAPPPESGSSGGVHVTSSSLTEGTIGSQYTCDGPNISPALAWTHVGGAACYAVIMDDATANDFVHWTLVGVPFSTENLLENNEVGRPGYNDFYDGFPEFGLGYDGPCPPGQGSGAPPELTGTHNYTISVFGLTQSGCDQIGDYPGSPPSLSREVFRDSWFSQILDEGEISFTYAAPGPI